MYKARLERDLKKELPKALKKELDRVGIGLVNKECKHEYIYQETIKRTEEAGYNTRYMRTDRYYCKFCLKIKEITKERYSRDAPTWF